MRDRRSGFVAVVVCLWLAVPGQAGDANALIRRGNAWWAKKEYAKAIDDYTEAIRLDPGDVLALNNKARILATCPDPQFRDSKRAIELARQACEFTKWKKANCVDTLAAAYAEDGQFAEAVRWQQKALDDPAYARENGEGARQRLELYRNNKPCRED